MIQVGVAGIGMVAPGIENWAQGRERLLAGDACDLAAPLPKLTGDILPANERRRITTHIKLALQCAQDAMAGATSAPADVATVFASSGGDLEIVDKIITSLGQPGKPISPTQFHNSVLNAAAGYWSIATHSHAASTSLSAHDASFAAGLLEAATQVEVEGHPVLLVASDPLSPPTLHASRPLVAPFGVALLLVPAPAQWVVTIELGQADAFSEMGAAELERLRGGNPAARSLPLLAQLASGKPGQVSIPYLSGLGLRLDVAAC
jgi:hypothetical protein